MTARRPARAETARAASSLPPGKPFRRNVCKTVSIAGKIVIGYGAGWTTRGEVMRQFSILVRIIGILCCALIVCACFVVISNHSMKGISDFSMHSAEQVMVEGQKAKLEATTHTMAVAMGEALKGMDEEAQAAALRHYLRDIRYESDKSGYFYAYKGTRNIALAPNPALEGQDLGDRKDVNGTYYVREMARLVRENGKGFVNLVFPKPGMGDQPKLNYMEAIPGTPFYLGTGVYLDNVAVEKDLLDRAFEEAFATQARFFYTVAGVGLVILLGASLVITSGIVRPLRKATDLAHAVSNGQLDVDVEVGGRDEIGRLEAALQEMVRTLRANISEIRKQKTLAEQQTEEARKAAANAETARQQAEGARREGMLAAADRLEHVVERLSTASSQLATQLDQASASATRSAERLSSAATAITEMNSTVQNVASNAANASEMSAETRQKAEGGAAIVQKSLGSIERVQKGSEALKEDMTQLNMHAQSISHVMSVISDIADQTNLLALNAAIEAARAGEAGRGFAVVADEVRKLAEKTMTSTSEVAKVVLAIQESTTKSMKAMDESLSLISQATDFAGKSGEALHDIVADAETTADEVRAIAAASEEQSVASEEINKSILEVNTTTTEGAGVMKEASQAVAELAREVQELRALVTELKRG